MLIRRRLHGASLLLVAAALGACAGAAPASPSAVDYTALDPLEVSISNADWLVTAFGSVWVKRAGGSVSRLDPATGEVTAEITTDLTDDELCEGLGAGSTALWTCSGNDLVRIDPGSNEVTSIVSADKIRTQGRLVFADDRVWVLSGAGDQLVGVADNDGTMTDPISLPLPCSDLATGAAAVYVLCEAGDQVLRVDPSSGTVTAQATVEQPVQSATNSGGLWVGSKAGIVKLDLATLTVISTTAGVVPGPFGGIWADDTAIFVRRVSSYLTRIDATTAAVTHVVTAPYNGGGDVVKAGDTLWTCDPEHAVLVRLKDPASS